MIRPRAEDGRAGPRAAGENSRLRAAILRWYRTNRRDLPWRRTRDPYAIWVSEIMLQQTRVETVIPYYRRFLDRFPDPAALARARESDVLSTWSGLGYYRRARNLHRAAELLVREHGGRVPDDPARLRALPGVGDYTAAAIESIAFHRPAAAVDGNVIRVLSRIEGWTGRRDAGPLRRSATRLAEELAHGPHAGDWTQALMELGATTCLPRAPLCERCPARARCVAAASGHPDRFPEAARKPTPKAERRVLLVARREGRILLVPDGDAVGGSWTLPTATSSPRRARTGRDSTGRRAAGALARRLGQELEPGGPTHVFRHRTFSHDLTFEVWNSRPLHPGGKAPAAIEGARWARPGALRALPLRSPTLKALRKLRP